MARAHHRSSRRSPHADASVDLARLLEVVSAFSRQTICVLGDFVLDEFVSGDISRVSREAPVLILRHRRSDAYAGGGANAAMNLACLGARVLAVGVVGDDDGGRTLLDQFRSVNIDARGVSRVKGWTTPVKTRYLAGWTHTTEQQVLRVDREPCDGLPDETLKKLETNARGVTTVDTVLVSDYGFGSATPNLVQRLSAKRITVDSRYRLLEYRNCGVTAATPNEYELQTAYHTEIGSSLTRLQETGDKARAELGLEALVVTRGRHGLALFQRDAAKTDNRLAHHVPVYGSDEAVDVTGAGDTVIAVFTLALAAGATYLEAAHLANYAGGIVVMKRRTATVTRGELEAALRAEVTAKR